MSRSIQDQLVKNLADVHSIEEQALTQLRAAPKIAREPQLAKAFEEHLRETEAHESRVREALEGRDAGPSALKDAAGKLGGWGMLAFAESQPDSPGKLVAHAYSYEHMEMAAYELLGLIAKAADDTEVVAMAAEIGAEEGAMAERLEACFDAAVEASLLELGDGDIDSHLDDYIADAHALEAQAMSLLKAAPMLAGDDELAAVFEDHLAETREHEKTMRARLEARGGSTSKVKDAALAIGGLNVGGFLAAQPDTPIKLVGFAFAFEHIEAASYELLRRIAAKAGDEETSDAATKILAQERGQGARIRDQFERVVNSSLEERGLAA